MKDLTRRKFLEGFSAVSAGLLIASRAPAVFADAVREPHISFPTAPRDRISVASYPFRAYIEAPESRGRDPKLPGMDLKDFAAEVAKKFNVHSIEPHSRHFRSLESEYLAEFRKALRTVKVRAV